MERCRQCDRSLYSNASLQSYGDGSTGILLLLDMPSKTDDKYRLPLSGRAGKFFQAIICKAGLKMSELAITYVLKCYSPTKYSFDEVIKCNPLTQSEINRVKDDLHLIIPVGGIATKILLGKATLMKDVVGNFYRKDGMLIYPIHHYKLAYNDELIKLKFRDNWRTISRYYKTVNPYHIDNFKF